MHCYRCYGDMVEVTIVNKKGRVHKAVVCVDCGRIYSKEGIFKGLYQKKVN